MTECNPASAPSGRWTAAHQVGIICGMGDDSRPVVGRDAELRAVDGFLDAAHSRFAVLTLEGEAGIGKTTVWQQGVRRAKARGAQVLPTRPSEAEATLSYAGLADLFDAVGEATIGQLALPLREAISAALAARPGAWHRH